MIHFSSALILAGLVFSLSSAKAESSGGGQGHNLVQRAEKREAKRWTLQEWLEQRDRNRMMDLWLSMNSPSPYEFMLGGSHNGYSYESTTNTAAGLGPIQHTSYSAEFSAYAQIVGLTAEYENNTEEHFSDLNGLFNLRLFGDSIQGSYLAVHYGVRTRTSSVPDFHFTQHLAQVSLQMYAIKSFGVDALYRAYYPTEVNTVGVGVSENSGSLVEGGAFIDFKNFRFFGRWYKESTLDRTATSENNIAKTGLRTGIKLYF
jgi:hypothetical protein